MGWGPVLEGALAGRAHEAVDAITSALENANLEGPGFSNGGAGFALYYYYASALTRSERHVELSGAFLDRAIDGVASGRPLPALYAGYCGVAWTIQHLQGRLLDPVDDPNEGIDEALLEHLAEPELRHFDLISGAAGLAVYLLERLQHPGAQPGEVRRGLEMVLGHLEKKATALADGMTWFTPPELLIATTKLQFPKGYYNLGLAHGSPGVIGVLAAMHEADVERPRTGKLLREATRWLMAQRLPEGERLRFPSYVVPDTLPTPSRLAWCYGDLGIVAPLLQAARALDDPALEREALELARGCAACAVERSGVRDAGVCHGAAGNAHIFNRLFQATGEPIFRDAALTWFDQTLALRLTDEGIAGFRSWRTTPGTQTSGWVDDPAFLTGAAGIGLALMAGLSSVEPAWDRVLLTSLPVKH